MVENKLGAEPIQFAITQEDYDRMKICFETGKTIENRYLKRKGWHCKLVDGRLRVSVDNREVVPKEKVMEVLDKLWNEPSVGLVGRDRFYERIKKLYCGISKGDIAEYLRRNETSARHQQPRHQKEVIAPIVTKGPRERMQMDLIDMQKYSTHNNGYSWILNIIDCFTKRVHLYALKNKGSKEIAKIVDKLFTEEGPPAIVQSDNGLEFKNDDMRAVTTKHHCQHIFSAPYSPQSNGAVERSNKTLKALIFRQFTNANTKLWVNDLPAFEKNINTAYHSTIKMTPEELAGSASHPPSKKQVRFAADNIQAAADEMVARSNAPKLKVGDYVRINNMVNPDHRKNKLFTKKFLPNYSDEVYKIIAAGSGRYFLNSLDRPFASKDLLKVSKEVIHPHPVRTKGKVFDKAEHLREVARRPMVRELPVVEPVHLAAPVPIPPPPPVTHVVAEPPTLSERTPSVTPVRSRKETLARLALTRRRRTKK